MIDIMPDDKEISKALNVLNSISDKLRYEKICEISEAQKNTYKKLLEKFKQLHDISPTDNAPKNLHNLKGEALENLVSYLLTISGNIFNVDRNLRTSTNEIDQIVTLTPQGKVLLTYHLIDPKLDTFLGECKNYDNAEVEIINPVADTVATATFQGAEVDWYIKAEDIVLKKGAAMNPHPPKKDTPPVK